MPEFLPVWLVIAAFVGIVGWAVINDVLSYRIPNVACAALALLYPAWLAVAWPAEDPLLTVGLHLAVGFSTLVAGFVLFSLRAFGAGDAKLLAAVALWAGPAGIFDLVIYTAIAGGLLAVAVLLLRRLAQVFEPQLLALQLMLAGLATRMFPRPASVAGAPRPTRHTSFARPIPYGVAIAVGAAAVAYGLLTTSGAA